MTSTNDGPEPTDSHRTADRTGLLHAAEGVVIYDRENPSGWIQSADAVSLADRC
ncbi:hypothetical protein SAMN04487947_0858 [Halogeometricum rufum]|jgi:hypothetical protein|uniref:Uncharacterized protein n=1 Tax=Halogeometricum rufum TaxID=553469 RepID=A0A1I6GB22_9EURY|nr:MULTISPECIES: hypothetical protein [Halogeometricum]MUV58558.1 hypothetical protein [Halogeometricum sp. CBA1124]SFR39412.1 hypothetical protein SAMN04487947_0858 [Halogeometricum rufum]